MNMNVEVEVEVKVDGGLAISSLMEFEDWKQDVTPAMAMLYSAKEFMEQSCLTKEEMAGVFLKVIEEDFK